MENEWMLVFQAVGRIEMQIPLLFISLANRFWCCLAAGFWFASFDKLVGVASICNAQISSIAWHRR